MAHKMRGFHSFGLFSSHDGLDLMDAEDLFLESEADRCGECGLAETEETNWVDLQAYYTLIKVP